MDRRKARLLLMLIAALTLTACDLRTIHDRYAHTGNEGWERSDTVAFSNIVVPKDGVYAEAIGLRLHSGYPFQGLTLIVEQSVRPRGTVCTDTLRLRLTDANGQSLGSGTGLSQHRFPLRSLTLQEGDTLSIRIRHNMKRETLPGITDVGAWVRRQ